MKRFGVFVLRALLVVLVIGLVVVGRFTWRIYRPPAEALALPPSSIPVDSAEGRRMLARAERADYAALAARYVRQQHGSFCGIASSVIVTNALGLGPVTQESFFDEHTAPIQTRAEAFFGGITLDELGRLLAAHGARTDVVHARATPADVERFRAAARTNLGRDGDVVLVNYDRVAVHQVGGGHISPLGAYDPVTDRFLVLDTAGYKYPPHWVGTAELHRAMATTDTSSGRSRGWVEASRAP